MSTRSQSAHHLKMSSIAAKTGPGLVLLYWYTSSSSMSMSPPPRFPKENMITGYSSHVWPRRRRDGTVPAYLPAAALDVASWAVCPASQTCCPLRYLKLNSQGPLETGRYWCCHCWCCSFSFSSPYPEAFPLDHEIESTA